MVSDRAVAADAAALIGWDVSVDSTVNRAHQHATNLPRTEKPTGADLLTEPTDHGIGRSRGGLTSKIHHLVDGRGLPLVVLVGAGQAHDNPMLAHLLAHLRVERDEFGRPRTTPDRARADKAHSAKNTRELLRRRHTPATIPQPSDQIRHRKNRGSSGGRPPAFDAEDSKSRHVVEGSFAILEQWRGLATRNDILAIVHRAGAVFNANTNGSRP